MEGVNSENNIISNEREILLNSTPEDWIKRNFTQRSCNQAISDKDKKYDKGFYIFEASWH